MSSSEQFDRFEKTVNDGMSEFDRTRPRVQDDGVSRPGPSRGTPDQPNERPLPPRPTPPPAQR